MLTFFINFMLRNNATEYFSGFRGIRVEKLKGIKLNNVAIFSQGLSVPVKNPVFKNKK